jgi:hypothetical protein
MGTILFYVHTPVGYDQIELEEIATEAVRAATRKGYLRQNSVDSVTGKNTGDNFARHFSNRDGSLQTSLGLFRTVGTYTGSNGYSLKLDGLEPGFNDKAQRRAVVMHGAPYVSEDMARTSGAWAAVGDALRCARRLRGRSSIRSSRDRWSLRISRRQWLNGSRFLNGCSATPAGS